MKRYAVLLLIAVVGCGSPPVPENEGPQQPLSFDYLQSMPPRQWIEQPPEGDERLANFKVPRARHDPEDGEVIVFKGLGGSPEENIKRWKGQFLPAEGNKIEDVAKVEEFKVSGCPVAYLDVSGTFLFKDRRRLGPAAKEVKKEEFRMLAVHFQGPRNVYHVLLRGPAKTVGEQKQAFDEWLKGFK